ncbi:MAG: peptidyl-prolyl cis-trans isomerase [Cellvibrionaceae bacterium]|nr:peptidyl-prolyl cis-trans isomerase [Cellvibrionaceae bacterium]
MKKIKPLWKDPLIHFFIIGGLIYLFSRFIPANPQPHNQIIVVNDQLINEIKRDYIAQYGKVPDRLVLSTLVDRWLHSELLYRKGLEFGLDKSDIAIRERVIQKTEQLYKSLIDIAAPSEQELQQWYQTKQHNYLSASKYSFEHVLVNKTAENAQQIASAALADIQHGKRPESLGHRYQQFNLRNEVNLQISFGKGFAKHIKELEPQVWAMLESNKYWHIIKITQHHRASLPQLADIQQQVYADWYKQQQQRELAELISKLKQDFQIIRGSDDA